jgi:RND family efflux transporter MFP subunit
MSGTTREAAAETRPSVTVLDQVLWQSLTADAPLEAFARAWLTLQCRAIARAERGVLVLRDEAGMLAPAARWPEHDQGSAALARAAELALEHGSGVANPAASRIDGGTGATLAYPLAIDGAVAAVAAVECGQTTEAALREAMRALQWGLGGIEALLRRRADAARESRLALSVAALDIAATMLSAPRFDDAARALATEIANRTGARAVAVGWRRRSVRVQALSHGLAFSRGTDRVRALTAAMEEAIDHERSIALPLAPEAAAFGTQAHARLLSQDKAGAVLTVPMVAADRQVGAITLEWDEAGALTQDQVDLAEAIAAFAGPVLLTMHRGERALALRAGDIVWREAGRLLGPGHLTLKLTTLAVAGVVAFFALFTTEYRIAAKATVEGETRRTVAAGLDGYIATQGARAGQTVRRGDVLATLDSGELTLQRLRWQAQREQRRTELDRALAGGQRADVNIAQAQISEANAQIALLDEQIARTRIVAPFDGIVLSGDLSQSVGSAVQRAQTLFEIAPLDAWRVVARVPDSEIQRIAPGQRGTLVLTALPDDRFPLAVTMVTPVAETSDGANAFRVEARLEAPPDVAIERLRPNMEGAAKIEVGRHHLIWIWTHRLIESARIWLWSWWP